MNITSPQYNIVITSHLQRFYNQLIVFKLCLSRFLGFSLTFPFVTLLHFVLFCLALNYTAVCSFLTFFDNHNKLRLFLNSKLELESAPRLFHP